MHIIYIFYNVSFSVLSLSPFFICVIFHARPTHIGSAFVDICEMSQTLLNVACPFRTQTKRSRSIFFLSIVRRCMQWPSVSSFIRNCLVAKRKVSQIDKMANKSNYAQHTLTHARIEAWHRHMPSAANQFFLGHNKNNNMIVRREEFVK